MPLEEITYREGVKTALSNIQTDQQEIIKMVRYTNGKVKKIIIALVLVFGILIGQNFQSTHDIITLFANAIHL